MSKTTQEDYGLKRNWENLALAIVVQAAMDYEEEYTKTLRRGYWTSGLRKLNTFFNSNWGKLLSFGKADEIRSRIKTEVEERLAERKRQGVEPTEYVWTGKHYRLLTYNGVTKPVTYWAKDFGLRPNTITRRLDYGWSLEKALTTKVHRRNLR